MRFPLPKHTPATLFAQAELLNESAVALNIRFLQVVQKFSALAHKLEQSRAGMKVFFMGFEVVGQAVNTARK